MTINLEFDKFGRISGKGTQVCLDASVWRLCLSLDCLHVG